MGKKSSKNNELSYICTQLSILLNSGISPRDGLELCMEGGGSPMEEEIKKAVELIDMGEPFPSALEQAGFPTLMTAMIEVGEGTGNLEQVTGSLGRYYQRLEEAKSALSSAILYPSMIFILMLCVQGVLCAKVLPVMASALTQSGGALTGMASVFASIGLWISNNMFVSVGVLLVLAVAVIVCLVNIEGFAKSFLGNTGWGKTSDKASCVSAMAMAMRAGADSDTAVRMAIPVARDRDPLDQCLRMMGGGTSFGAAMEKCGMLDPSMARLLDAGVRGGCADTVMEQLAERMDKAANDKLDKTLSSVEPALVAVMAIMTGVILLSVMSPLASLIASV